MDSQCSRPSAQLVSSSHAKIHLCALKSSQLKRQKVVFLGHVITKEGKNPNSCNPVYYKASHKKAGNEFFRHNVIL